MFVPISIFKTGQERETFTFNNNKKAEQQKQNNKKMNQLL
jgi:hypothetical protein